MSDIAVQLVDPEDNSKNQYPRTLAQLVATASGSDVETELGNKKTKQTAVPNPNVDGSGVDFVDSVTQNTNGDITPHRKTVRTMGASGQNHASGLVPDPGPTAGTTKYLCENGQWSEPGGGGGGGTSTPTDVQINGTSITNNNVANIQTQSNYDATNNKIATMDDLPSVPSAATNSPNMDGTAAVGSSSKYAKEDHVHPTDTTRASSTHTHGNIQNGGTLNDAPAAPAGDDYMVIRDGSDNKIQTSNVKGTAVKDAVDKKHSHSDVTLSTTAQNYDGSHTIKLPTNDPYSSARPPQSHSHGNITNDGKLQTNDVVPATSGDKLVITDGSDSGKVARSNIEFNGTHGNEFLRKDGQWATPPTSSGGVSDVKIVWGTGSSAQASTVTSNISSIMVHGTYDPNNLQRVATLKIPSSISGSGYLVEYNTSTKNLDVTGFKTSDLCLGFKKDGVNTWYYPGFGQNSSGTTVGGVILGSGLNLAYDITNHTITISASVTAGVASIATGSACLSVTPSAGTGNVTLTLSTATMSTEGLLMVYADEDSGLGYCNRDNICAIPIYNGSVTHMWVKEKGEEYTDAGRVAKSHYVNVQDIVDAFGNEEFVSELIDHIIEFKDPLDKLKKALGLK